MCMSRTILDIYEVKEKYGEVLICFEKYLRMDMQWKEL